MSAWRHGGAPQAAAMKTDRSIRPDRRGWFAWMITLAATAASTYALDAVATAAGVLLVASQLLSGLDHPLVLAFLAATYALWGVALRANLRANWLLLCRTATSTNVLSKAAFEFARRRGARVQRIAAGAGYVATEIAKEAPYYAGAFGAAVLSDAVSSSDALIFLAGANLGATVYEFGLARLTRKFLRRPRCASFDTDWVPRDYLADYYRVVEPDERETIAFFTDAITHAPAGEAVLVFGTGPTLHHVFLAAPHASEIHLADYLPANLEEIERWRARDPAAHDWRAFVRYTLECEGLIAPTDADVTRREELTRSKITRLLQVDARGPVRLERRYATVISADAARVTRAPRAACARGCSSRAAAGFRSWSPRAPATRWFSERTSSVLSRCLRSGACSRRSICMAVSATGSRIQLHPRVRAQPDQRDRHARTRPAPPRAIRQRRARGLVGDAVHRDQLDHHPRRRILWQVLHRRVLLPGVRPGGGGRGRGRALRR